MFIQDDYDESKLRFGKVILLADVDPDGFHICNLCTSFFINYMPDLIKNGHLYIIDAPLFIATGAKVKAFGMTRAEVDKKMKALKCTDYTVSRLKGWGEANAEQLSDPLHVGTFVKNVTDGLGEHLFVRIVGNIVA